MMRLEVKGMHQGCVPIELRNRGGKQMEQHIMGVAVIGCGIIANNHIQPILEMEQAELLYLVDVDEPKAKDLAKTYRCDYGVDIDQVLQDDRVQVVHILTPHYLHYPMTKKAIEAGKHVVLEKPVTIHVEDARDLERLAKRHHRQVATVFQNRLNPSSIEAKHLINSGQLGVIKGIKAVVTWSRDGAYYEQADWRGKWKTEGGGLLINQAIHVLDLMRWLGGPMKKIKGHVDTRLLDAYIEVDDTADATITYDSGAVGIFYGTNNYVDNSAIEMEILGEKAKLRLMDNGLWLDKGQGYKQITHDEKATNGKSYWGNSHELLIKKAYEAIAKGDKIATDITEGLKTLEIVQGIYQSSKTGEDYYFKQ